jgi:hypothetical protein
MGRDLRWILTHSINDIERIRLGETVDTMYLEELKAWLCEVSCHMRETITANRFPSMSYYHEIVVVSLALGYDLSRPIRGDTIGAIFPKLHSRITSILCILEKICQDPSAESDPNEIRELLSFCFELSESFIVNRSSFVSQLVA